MVMAVMMRRAVSMAQFERWFIPMSCDRVFLCPATTHHLPHSCDESRHSSRRTPRGCAPGGHLFGQYRFSGLIVCSLRTSPVARSVTVSVSAVARMRTLVFAWARPMPSRCIVPALRSVTFPDSSIRSKRIRCGSKPEVSPGVALIVAV